jgi:hypothetical protein
VEPANWSRTAAALRCILGEIECELAALASGPLSLTGQERRAQLAEQADELHDLLRLFTPAAASVRRPGDGTVTR